MGRRLGSSRRLAPCRDRPSSGQRSGCLGSGPRGGASRVTVPPEHADDHLDVLSVLGTDGEPQFRVRHPPVRGNASAPRGAGRAAGNRSRSLARPRPRPGRTSGPAGSTRHRGPQLRPPGPVRPATPRSRASRTCHPIGRPCLTLAESAKSKSNLHCGGERRATVFGGGYGRGSLRPLRPAAQQRGVGERCSINTCFGGSGPGAGSWKWSRARARVAQSQRKGSVRGAAASVE